MKFSSTNQPKSRGTKKVHRDIVVANSMTKTKLEGLLNLHLWMDQKQLRTAMRATSTPMINRAIASIIMKAVDNGDEKRLGWILDRLIGKPKEEINITAYMTGLKKMTDVQVIDMGSEAIKFLRSKEDTGAS
jgi:hypothetical protein